MDLHSVFHLVRAPFMEHSVHAQGGMLIRSPIKSETSCVFVGEKGKSLVTMTSEDGSYDWFMCPDVGYVRRMEDGSHRVLAVAVEDGEVDLDPTEEVVTDPEVLRRLQQARAAALEQSALPKCHMGIDEHGEHVMPLPLAWLLSTAHAFASRFDHTVGTVQTFKDVQFIFKRIPHIRVRSDKGSAVVRFA
jgi:hypothetical protein